MSSRFLKIAFSFILIFFYITTANAEIVFQDDFDSYSTTITGWSIGDNISLQQNGGINNSKCAHISYTREGTSPYWFSRNISDQNLNEIYVRFYFKVDDPSGGCKFLKLFGKINSPSGYANTTFMINYFNSTLYEISYGAGGIENDTADVIRYSGYTTDSRVSVLEASGPFDPRDGAWHCFEAHIKYNDNGQRNGIYQVWVDGELYVHATNVVNRNDLNSMFFASVDLANYSSSALTHSWNLWYDNVVISTTPIGCLDGNVAQEPTPEPTPAPPSNLRDEAAQSSQVSLAWDPSPSEPDGYKVYYGTTTGQHPYVLDVGNRTTSTVNGLQDATRYYFIVTAYQGSQESSPSNEISAGYFPNDTEAPQISVTGPSTSILPSVNLSGTATDNQSVAQITWASDSGHTGTAYGTSNWVISGVPLVEGTNQITVTAIDISGNTGSASIAIEYQQDAEMQTLIFGDTPDSDYSRSIEDTFLRVDDAVNYSDDTERLPVYTWPSGNNANIPILKINLAPISQDAVIQSAILYLYNTGYEGTGGDDLYEISAHKIINVDPVATSANWMTYDGSRAWTGGNGGGTQDIESSEYIAQIDKNTGYKTWDVTQMVRDWIADPSSNHGIMLRSDIEGRSASSDTNRIFAPTENDNANIRPKLVVIFSGNPNSGDQAVVPSSPSNLQIAQ